MTEDLKIWIVEDHRAYREQLAEALANTPSLNVRLVKQFGTGDSFLRAYAAAMRDASQPDVILLDIQLPGGKDGLGLLKEIRQTGVGDIGPQPNVIMLTMLDDPTVILEALATGASGYLLKSAALSYIVESIAQARRGGLVLHPEITAWLAASHTADTRRAQPQPGTPTLTQRESEVLTLLADGLLKKEIADRLGLSFHTVDGYLRQIYEKLNVPNKNAAVAEALKMGLIATG